MTKILTSRLFYLKKIQMPLSSGAMALMATIIIWASYFVTLRSGAQSSLTAFDMAVLRFILPAVLLLPVLIKSRKKILNVKKRYLLGVAVGAGLPFYYISVIASGNVQAVIGSLLVPGVAPLFVTVLAVVFYKERLVSKRAWGLAIVLTGISVLVVNTLRDADSTSLIGISFYVLAAACWAVYTVSIKLAGLSGLQLAAFLNFVAAIGLLILLPFDFFNSNLSSSSWSDIYPQLVIMGVFCGFVAAITYGHAINQLGAEMSACWGAITPVVVSVFAYIALSETVDQATFIAMVMIIMGVVLANFNRKFRKVKTKA